MVRKTLISLTVLAIIVLAVFITTLFYALNNNKKTYNGAQLVLEDQSCYTFISNNT